MDATELGIQIFFLILLPGFLSGVGFRATSGNRSKNSDFATICYSAFIGVILLSFLFDSNSEKIARLISNPMQGGVVIALIGFFVGMLIGLPVGWIRRVF